MRLYTKKSLAVLTKELDGIFSDFIRLRDSENGRVTCFICGVSIPWKQSHNMHFVVRGEMPGRYHEDNCHAGCEQCNCYDPKHRERYQIKMYEMYGGEETDALERIILTSLAKFMRLDLIEKIEFYREKVKEIKKQKGL